MILRIGGYHGGSPSRAKPLIEGIKTVEITTIDPAVHRGDNGQSANRDITRQAHAECRDIDSIYQRQGERSCHHVLIVDALAESLTSTSRIVLPLERHVAAQLIETVGWYPSCAAGDLWKAFGSLSSQRYSWTPTSSDSMFCTLYVADNGTMHSPFCGLIYDVAAGKVWSPITSGC